jgi:predicted glycogen debranching enzyme
MSRASDPLRIADGRLLGALTSREWLLADGRGGYAFGTQAGLNTRKYHGLLVVSRPPPAGRLLLVSRLEETLLVENDERVSLDLACYEPGIFHPDGYARLTGFSRTPSPTWTYEAAGRTIRKIVELGRDGSGLRVRWELDSGGPATLLVRPLLTRRSHHAVLREKDLAPEVSSSGSTVSWRARPGEPATILTFDGELVAEPPYFYRDVLYSVERERGYDAIEDLHAPCLIRFDLAEGEPVTLAATAEDEPQRTPIGAAPVAAHRRRGAVNEDAREALLAAADQFLIQDHDDQPGVVAGYPWFEEWGRDTMIALPGLCLATGRFELAFRVLEAWASRVSRGLLPNRLGDQHEVETNSADAPLLMIRSIELLDYAIGDRQRIEEGFAQAVTSVLDAYHEGTDHGIGVDTDGDGLLRAGEAGRALTWMDAIVGGEPVTPRRGKPIELNALYLEALRYGAELCDRSGDDERGALYRTRMLAVETSMRERFLDPDTGLISDVVDPTGPGDPHAFRPNLLFALAALSSPFPAADAERNLAKVELDLLTPFGLRTLVPDHPFYVSAYRGDQVSRDRAYHQGTVWPWLIGIYVDALVRLRGDDRKTRAKVETALAPLMRYVVDHGSVPEVFDGDQPHAAGGCPAQAWSVAELLRVVTWLES